MPVPRLPGPPVACAAGAVALVAAASPAVAAPVAPGVPAPAAVAAGGAVRSAVDDASGVAGYVASVPAASRHTATATFKVPSVVCPARSTDPLFVSSILFGQASATDTTFDYASAGITVTCTQGVPFYEASVDTNPERQSGAVSPGDVLQIKVVVSRSGTTLTLTDTTSGGVFTVTGSAFVAQAFQSSTQGGFGTGKFPRPTPVRTTTATVDGALLATLTPNHFDQTTASGQLVLKTSDLTDRSGFTVNFVSQP